MRRILEINLLLSGLFFMLSIAYAISGRKIFFFSANLKTSSLSIPQGNIIRLNKLIAKVYASSGFIVLILGLLPKYLNLQKEKILIPAIFINILIMLACDLLISRIIRNSLDKHGDGK